MESKRRQIHLATGNLHKAVEMQSLADASGLAVEILPAKQMPLVVEDTGTFVGNARKKALALKAILPGDAWVLADDSGLCVDALEGAPGVESAYYAGEVSDPRANLAKLVEAMREVPENRRGAHFVCVLVLLRGAVEAEKIFEGRCSGQLRQKPAGGAGFGYDPLFVPQGYEKTYAELTHLEKNLISHRAVAWTQLNQWLERQG